MALGKTLARAALVADTNTVVYTVPAGRWATINCRTLNKSADADAIVDIAIIDGADPLTVSDADYIEYNVNLARKAILENMGIVLGENQSIVVKSTLADVNAVVFGVTQITEE